MTCLVEADEVELPCRVDARRACAEDAYSLHQCAHAATTGVCANATSRHELCLFYQRVAVGGKTSCVGARNTQEELFGCQECDWRGASVSAYAA